MSLTSEGEAREQIRDLVARYNAYGDSGRFEDLLRLFAPDAQLTVGSERYIGRDAIEAMFRDAASSARSIAVTRVRHFVATHQIDLVDEGHARGRCYFQVLTDRGLDHWGRYLDDYAADAGGWRFAIRTVEVEGAVPGGWGAAHLASRLASA